MRLTWLQKLGWRKRQTRADEGEMDQEIKQQAAVGDAPAAADAPASAAATAQADDGQVDDEVLMLAMATGARMLNFVASGDLEGLDAFVGEVRKQIERQRRLMRLLEMEQGDIDRLLEQLEKTSDAAEQVVQAGDAARKPSPARELYSPADSAAGNGRPKTGSLHDYIGISRK